MILANSEQQFITEGFRFGIRTDVVPITTADPKASYMALFLKHLDRARSGLEKKTRKLYALSKLRSWNHWCQSLAKDKLTYTWTVVKLEGLSLLEKTPRRSQKQECKWSWKLCSQISSTGLSSAFFTDSFAGICMLISSCFLNSHLTK